MTRETVLVIYLIGAVLAALFMYRNFWKNIEGLSADQVTARRAACVFVTLLWFAFVIKVVFQVAKSAIVRG